MLDNEHLRAQEVVREDDVPQGGPGAPACVADDMGVAGVDAGVHAVYWMDRGACKSAIVKFTMKIVKAAAANDAGK